MKSVLASIIHSVTGAFGILTSYSGILSVACLTGLETSLLLGAGSVIRASIMRNSLLFIVARTAYFLFKRYTEDPAIFTHDHGKDDPSSLSYELQVLELIAMQDSSGSWKALKEGTTVGWCMLTPLLVVFSLDKVAKQMKHVHSVVAETSASEFFVAARLLYANRQLNPACESGESKEPWSISNSTPLAEYGEDLDSVKKYLRISQVSREND